MCRTRSSASAKQHLVMADREAHMTAQWTSARTMAAINHARWTAEAPMAATRLTSARTMGMWDAATDWEDCSGPASFLEPPRLSSSSQFEPILQVFYRFL